jgi:hypothetical protein
MAGRRAEEDTECSLRRGIPGLPKTELFPLACNGRAFARTTYSSAIRPVITKLHVVGLQADNKVLAITFEYKLRCRVKDCTAR